MKTLRSLTGIAILCVAVITAQAQSLAAINQLWHQTVAAVQRGDDSQARTEFAAFNTAVRSYVSANGKSWQIEYLVGSLDCLFPDKKVVGAEFLRDILQNNRTLNAQGNAEVQKQLQSCEAPARAIPTAAQLTLPQDLTEASTHFQTPGIRGDMKGGGGGIRIASESSQPLSPVAAAELLSRQVSIHDPQTALNKALARLPAGANGAVTDEFAVATEKGSAADAQAIGRCLKRYATALNAEFQIDSPTTMVTAYAVPSSYEVYDFARRLHGLTLPYGVIAYSVPEDMSLVSPAYADSCGSMAHELVHLLIKRRFSGAPAWLEEGLASEVAVASPSATSLRFGWSWRDDTLLKDLDARPTASQLLDASWSDFNSDNYGGMHRAEATQAIAAVFIRYLNAKGQLPAIYFSVRDQHLTPDLSGFKSYQATLEDILKMPVASIDADFQKWFDAESRGHAPAYSSGGGSGEVMNAAPRPIKPCVQSQSKMQQAPLCAPDAPAAGNDPPKPNTKQ